MAVTHVELHNVSSCGIKGNLTWPSVLWFGHTREDILLMNKRKSKLLNIDDGSITKHNPLIDRLISESRTIVASKDGKLFTGVKKTGDLFVWDYIPNAVYSIAGLDDFKLKGDSLDVMVSDNIERILVVKNCNSFCMWVRGKNRSTVRRPPKLTPLEGRWFTMNCKPGIPLPLANDEGRLDQCTYEQDIFSSVAFLADSGVLQLSTLLITSEPSMYGQRMSAHVEWFSKSLAGSPEIPITATPDLLIVRYAPTLPLCAVIINQLSMRDQCVIFVSPRHQHQVSANLKCLRESATSGRSPLWIANVGWTYNSLLLVILTQSGCVAILSRMGDPLYLTTKEASITGAFDHLLSLLPRGLTSVKKSRGIRRSLSMSAANERQVSLSCHPLAMKFIISDGYQVLIFQIPEDITTRSLAMALLSDVRMLQQSRVREAAGYLTQSHHLHDATITPQTDQQLADSGLKSLVHIWCLLVSSDSWSKELKDVSNEVINAIGEFIHSFIQLDNIETSAVGVVRSTITLITMVAIDSQRQHALPASIKLISLVVKILLGEDNYIMDTKIKLTEIAFILVKICENIVNRTYSLLPMMNSHVMGDKSAHSYNPEVTGVTHTVVEILLPLNRSNAAAADQQGEPHTSLSVSPASLISRCLSPIYEKIQKRLSFLYQNCGADMEDMSSLYRVLEAVQSSLAIFYPPAVGGGGGVDSVWLHSDIMCLEGFHGSAITDWLEKYTDTPPGHVRMTEVLHSILYSKLYAGKLQDLLQFVEGSILEELSKHNSFAEKEYLNVRSLRSGSAVRRLVQTLARFMARYFTNSDLYVFPPHNPRPLPALYSSYSDYVTALSVDRKSLSDVAGKLPSADGWSVRATVRYLLISGLLSELVWFCRAIGDVKTSLSVSLLVSDHRTSLKHMKRHEVNAVLPDELKPEAIQDQMLSKLLQETESTNLRSSVHHLMLPTALFGLPCLTSQLSSIWKEIKSTASQLSALVPNELYLPCPALYCPQIAGEPEDLCDELTMEVNLRRTLSAHIKMLINVIIGTNTDLPCCGWFVRSLIEAWKRDKKSSKNTKLSMNKNLEVYIPYHIAESDKHNKLLFAVFRNVCGILWMLHVRDELSMKLRKSTELLQSRVTVTSQMDEAESLLTRYDHLEKTLSWCLRYLPFAQYLQCTNTLCEVIISICEDLPATAKLARNLSRGITDIDALAPEIKDRMDHLLQTWQTVDTDPQKSRSLSMYYFECCNKFENQADQARLEKNVFSTTQGHKVVGTRGFEFDSVFVNFLELFFSVSFHSSLPDIGTAKSPALVATNKKTLEQVYLTKQTLSFNEASDTLKSSLHEYCNAGYADGHAHSSASDTKSGPSQSDSPLKSGMFRQKRWSVSEEKTFKQMKRLGVSVKADQLSATPSDAQEALRFGTADYLSSIPPSVQLLCQNIRLSERYQKLGTKFQWLNSWCAKQTITSSTLLQPSTKVEIDVQWIVLALIMLEKSRHGTSRITEHILPPKSEIKLPATSTTSTKSSTNLESANGDNTNALANAISLHISTDMEDDLDAEEDLDRKEIFEEMRKHSRLATATQPINTPDLRLTGEILASMRKTPEKAADKVERGDTTLERDDERTGGKSVNSYLDDTGTTVWSSATLPNMSGSSHITTGNQVETIETVDQQSTAKTQQSVSTIGSRKSRRRTPDRLAPPVAESTHYAEDMDSVSSTSSDKRQFNSQIPLLRLSKENKNISYYSSSQRKLGPPHQNRQPSILQVSDWRGFKAERQQAESVKLPLLSVKASAPSADNSAKEPQGYDQYQLAQIREKDTRWNQSVPLLSMKRGDNQRALVEFQEPHSAPPQQEATAANSDKQSITMAHGPSLLREYELANQKKEELISRMIKIMRSKCKPINEEGKPTHPKYSLLKLDPSAIEASGSIQKIQRPEMREDGGYRRNNEPASSRQHRRKRSQKKPTDKPKADDLATVSERSETTPRTAEVGTEPASLAETDDKGTQHSPVHVDGRFTDYSYLFSLATQTGDEGDQIRVSDLDAAANEGTFAAIQYKAIKLQEEFEHKPAMVDASVMAVPHAEPRIVVLTQPPSTDMPSVAPNLIHDLQFTAPTTASYMQQDKENVHAAKRQYVGVVDIAAPIDSTYADKRPTNDHLGPKAEVPSQPRSQQILRELFDNTQPLHHHEHKNMPDNDDQSLNIPRYEYEELSPPRVIAPRLKRFVSAEVKDEGKLSITRHLYNMDDRLEYIEELRENMLRQIQDTDMILPRYHLSYQQRQTQTRLSIPSADEYITILEERGGTEGVGHEASHTALKDDSNISPQQQESLPPQAPSIRGHSTPRDRSPEVMDSARWATPHSERTQSGVSISRPGSSSAAFAKYQPAVSSRSRLDSLASAKTSATRESPEASVSFLDNTDDMVKAADLIVGDDQSLMGDINSSMLADLLGSDISLISQRLRGSGKKSKTRSNEELKKWRKEHQSKVREQYRQELENKRKPETRPFNSERNLTTKQIQKVKEEREKRKERMTIHNQSKRIESAENLLEDIIDDGAELLALERMMDLTRPITLKTQTKQRKPPSASTRGRNKSSLLYRGRSSIQTNQRPPAGYTPSGFRTATHTDYSKRLSGDYGYGRVAGDGNYDVNEPPLSDESHLLVPIFKEELEDSDRVRQLLYSDEAASRFGSEINLSNISDLVSESELSAGSYLDWDVVDEMVAILSNRELSTPSTAAGTL